MSMISEQVQYLRSLAADQTPEALYEVFDALNEAADTIEALSAKLANMEQSEVDCGGGWISCNKRLPELAGGTQYLVCLKNGCVSMAIFLHGGEFKEISYLGINEFFRENPIIAWRPLPEPYTENEKQAE